MNAVDVMRKPARPPASVAGSSARWGRVEWFVMALFLSSALLLVPGMSSLRVLVRALPYVLSIGMLMLYAERTAQRELPPAGKLLLLALVLLAVSLFHPLTQFPAGPAQFIFQISIAAPLFWGMRALRDQEHLEKLLWIVLVVNAVSAVVGVLQVFYPQHFMPASFNTSEAILAQSSFVNMYGVRVVRPPGLSDLPGGAGLAGMVAGVLGFAFAVRTDQTFWRRLFCMGATAASVLVLFLASTRALLIMLVAGMAFLFVLTLRQGRFGESRWIALLGGGAVFGAFSLAIALGGAAVFSRFSVLVESGLLNAYQKERGGFLAETFSRYLPEYPIGAGVGRWGMMQVYFGQRASWDSYPLHAEIQLTGWLFDGGVLMWVLYGGAVLAGIFYCYRIATSRASPQLKYLAAVICAVEVVIAGTTFAGPTFNMTLGILFWLLIGGLYGAVNNDARNGPRAQALAGSGPG